MRTAVGLEEQQGQKKDGGGEGESEWVKSQEGSSGFIGPQRRVWLAPFPSRLNSPCCSGSQSTRFLVGRAIWLFALDRPDPARRRSFRKWQNKTFDPTVNICEMARKAAHIVASSIANPSTNGWNGEDSGHHMRQRDAQPLVVLDSLWNPRPVYQGAKHPRLATAAQAYPKQRGKDERLYFDEVVVVNIRQYHHNASMKSIHFYGPYVTSTVPPNVRYFTLHEQLTVHATDAENLDLPGESMEKTDDGLTCWTKNEPLDSPTSRRWRKKIGDNLVHKFLLVDEEAQPMARVEATTCSCGELRETLVPDQLRTVSQIRSAAAMKTNQSVKGATPLTAMNSLRRLAEEAHLKEANGDLRGALYQFVQFVQESHEYKQETVRGHHGALYQSMQEFMNKGAFEQMIKSADKIQASLLQIEKAEASRAAQPDGVSDADSIGRRSGNSLAERLKQLQGSGIQAELIGRKIQRPPSQNFRPQSPPVLVPSRGPTPAPRGATPGPYTRRSSLSYVPIPPPSPKPTV
ncbi:5893_t:CDS:10, partial [Acaulospora colombiana]